jgi:tRNA A-37 threonylcarbamoyl transferase component Bud32
MTSKACPQCGKSLASDAPQGLCPECLFKAALASQSALDSAGTATLGASLAPAAGVQLRYFGDYELLEEIARGGMGVVWKARQASLNRVVAVKMIRAAALASPTEVERFLREAEAAANLQHPNIVAIHEVGEHGGQHYFSMDYVDGADLGALVKDGPLAPQRAARYVKIIAEAIHFAHQRGTMHRDLKPQNVLIDAADQPRITDFGLAKVAGEDSRLTQTGVVMGSPSYMPPEQAAGQRDDIGPGSDVYSLGAMLYELLTGQAPFRGATPLATLREVMETEPVPPRQLKPDIPRDVETICLKCLEKRPSARYPTARALAEELDRFLRGEPIQARPAGAVRKAVSWSRRHPGLLAAALAVVVVGLVFGVFYLFEENAFLRAKQADPSLTKARGPYYESLEIWHTINIFAACGGIYLMLGLIVRSRGLKLNELFDPNKNTRPTQPLGERMRAAAFGIGLVLIGCAIMHLVKTIQAHVWEGEPILGELFQLYPTTYMGLAALAFVIKDYHLSLHGVASRNLTAEQIEPIRRAMEDFDLAAAIKKYRDAVPDATLAEASNYAVRLAESLRAAHPGKYVPQQLSLRALNGKAMLICSVVEGIGLGIMWLTMPFDDCVVWTLRGVGAYLIGAGIMAGARVKGFWRRMLLLVPGLAALAISDAIVRHLTSDSPPHGAAPYVIGAVFGAFLMISGFTRRRSGAS